MSFFDERQNFRMQTLYDVCMYSLKMHLGGLPNSKFKRSVESYDTTMRQLISMITLFITQTHISD